MTETCMNCMYTITEKGHQWIKAAAGASPYKDNTQVLIFLIFQEWIEKYSLITYYVIQHS